MKSSQSIFMIEWILGYLRYLRNLRYFRKGLFKIKWRPPNTPLFYNLFLYRITLWKKRR